MANIRTPLTSLPWSFCGYMLNTKVHLFSASMSPEHWAFLKHWKEIFPSAEVWAVPGPHRRLMGVKARSPCVSSLGAKSLRENVWEGVGG